MESRQRSCTSKSRLSSLPRFGWAVIIRLQDEGWLSGCRRIGSPTPRSSGPGWGQEARSRRGVPDAPDVPQDILSLWARLMAQMKKASDMEQRMPRLILAGVLLLVAIGLTDLPTAPKEVRKNRSGGDDADLEQSIIDQMRAGGTYYATAVTTMRYEGYCLRPFVNIRLPALASFMAIFPTNTIPRAVLIVLSCMVLMLWIAHARSLAMAVLIGVLLLFLILFAVAPDAVRYQDAWAGPLIALALAVHRKDWRLSLLFGILALAIREHALVLAAVMCVSAWRNRRECMAWGVVIIGFAIYLSIHAWLVSGHVLPDDRAKTWVAFGGWSFIVSTGQCTFAFLTPAVVSAVIIPVALLGLASLDDYRPLAVVGTYMGAFLFVGNPNSGYWGLLYAPLLAVGVAAGIPALWVLLKSIVCGNHVTSSRTETAPGSDPN